MVLITDFRLLKINKSTSIFLESSRNKIEKKRETKSPKSAGKAREARKAEGKGVHRLTVESRGGPRSSRFVPFDILIRENFAWSPSESARSAGLNLPARFRRLDPKLRPMYRLRFATTVLPIRRRADIALTSLTE